MIPNTFRNVDEFLSNLSPDMIILTGGGECPAQLDIATKDPQNSRILTERALVAYSVANNIPLLGVCRGFQFINPYFGGAVTRNLTGAEPTLGNHVATEHDIFFVEQDWSDLIRANQMQVNSFHDDGILVSQLASCLDITAVADDEGRLVEGFRHKFLPISGIQWHPERSETSLEFDRLLIEKIIGRAKN